MEATATTSDLRALLLWCRQQGFRVSEVEMGGVTLTIDDLRIETAGAVEPAPRTPHHGWAKAIGMDPSLLDDPEDDEDGQVAS